MLARIAILSGLAMSLCMADNFLIKGGQNADSIINMKAEHSSSGGSTHDTERAPQEPTRVVIEDVNPNSELGQAIHYILKEAQKKEIADNKPKVVKKVVKKKPKKKVVKKAEDCVKVPQEHVMEMSQLPSGEAIKAKEAPVVDEKPKAEGAAEPKAEAGHEAAPKEEHGAKAEEKKEEKAPAKEEHKKPAEKKAH